MAVRSYTPIKPILPDEEDGTFQVLVKTYFPNTSPFPPGGTVSNWLDILQIGDEMDVKGPSGDIEYKVICIKAYLTDRATESWKLKENHSNLRPLIWLEEGVELLLSTNLFTQSSKLQMTTQKSIS